MQTFAFVEIKILFDHVYREERGHKHEQLNKVRLFRNHYTAYLIDGLIAVNKSVDSAVFILINIDGGKMQISIVLRDEPVFIYRW